MATEDDSTTLAGEGAAASSEVMRVPRRALSWSVLLGVALFAVAGINRSDPFFVGTRAAGLLGR